MTVIEWFSNEALVNELAKREGVLRVTLGEDSGGTLNYGETTEQNIEGPAYILVVPK